MNESIIQVPLYVSTSAWRKEVQLRGLLRNHPSIIAHSDILPPATTAKVFSTAQLAAHHRENVLAIGLNPLSTSGACVGLLTMESAEAKLSGMSKMQWLNLPSTEPLSSVEWCEGSLLVGTSRGRIVVADVSPQTVEDSDGELQRRTCLVCSEEQTPVGDIVVPPSKHAVSTLVRCVRSNAAVCSSSVVAVCDSRAMVWDVKGATQPVHTWVPSVDSSKNSPNEQEPLLFAQWVPNSDSVVLTGSYSGSLVFTDIRTKEGSTSKLSLPARRGCMARCADFNTLLPFALATASSDGIISVFDCRYPSTAVRTIPSLHGDIMSLKYLKLHSDIIATGGVDGSVVLWNLRSLPTYRVGRAQYKCPVFDLITTPWSVEQHVIGVTCGGELTLTGLAQEAMATLAVPVTERLSKPSGRRQEDKTAANEATELMEREKYGVGLLYSRRLREAYEVIVDCATKRFARKEITMAMRLAGLLDVKMLPKFDYRAKVESFEAEEKCKRELGVAALSQSQVIVAFEDALVRSSQWLFPSLLSENIRDLQKPAKQDVTKLEALQLNLLLHNNIASGCIGSVVGGLQYFIANGGNISLIDANTACSIAKKLLEVNVAEGQKFVSTLLSLVIEPDGTAVADALAKRLLIVVQEPLVTAGMPARQAGRHEELFVSDLLSAKRAVEVQMEIRSLGIENYKGVIAAVNKYQDQCLRNGESGIFGWLAQEPLMLFLNCLTADSNYATFFWACVQLIEALAACPGMREVEATLFATVNSIHVASNRLRSQLQELASKPRFTPATVREAGKTITTVLDFSVVLLRVQLECENVAHESEMRTVPPVMCRIFDILSSASSDLLKVWETILGVLVACPLRSLVRKCCLTGMRNFALKVEGLLSLSSKKGGDEMLNEILDTCDEFFDRVAEDAD
ncbi:hypothetical protein, conserved [Trypanosoma brucei gambiense DAL972]|uniref:Uncharacterized protein n=1 Tax=Trypanosoma brucei gambiense (strain MHOM/CI/86/DAL972) TaxID=679716 RepID=D0A113_TRYB9|nr:hypothetical protein, conserved [Trypanosoma brucei gambiense DAL972]CBH14955.1 hypothetical protein, conserved [Trypanosoma brucei gambiense DAL972]|eukprot:XP_011777221.1 hypothetical protein, conserved [Trypanosoma brucei gambiense DAL972]